MVLTPLSVPMHPFTFDKGNIRTCTLGVPTWPCKLSMSYMELTSTASTLLAEWFLKCQCFPTENLMEGSGE